MKRIPDTEQRMVYDVYVRDGFRSKQNLIPGSRQAIRAVEDAMEQVESMNYYHSIREMKEEQRRSKENYPSKPSKGQQKVSAEESQSSIPGDGPTATDSPNTYTSSTPPDASEKLPSALHQEKCEIVQKWLVAASPHLHTDDITLYALRLVDDGFDSFEMLETELLQEDLTFMKKAHQRALVRVKGISRS
jgi:hypothetical protein